MKITKQELIDMNACEGGLTRFILQTNDTDEPVDVASLVGGCNTIGDLMWLACRYVPHPRLFRLACDCALTCVELTKPYTDNYDELVQFLKEPTGGDADRAAAIALAADRAAFNVIRITRGEAAAVAAARSAAYAANGVTSTAAAVAAYASDGSRQKVHQLIIDMFNEVES